MNILVYNLTESYMETRY